MKVNDGVTWVDKIKPYQGFFLSAMVILLVFIYFIVVRVMENNERAEKARIAFEKEKRKVDLIQKTKPALVCKGKYYAPNQYDVVAYESRIIIETLESLEKPKTAMAFNECNVYEKLTSSIVIPPPLTMEERVAKELKTLKSQNAILTQKLKDVGEEKIALEKMNLDKTSEIERLVELVGKKQKDIDTLSDYSVKYNEVKELLHLALGGESKRFSKFLAKLEEPVKAQKEFAMKEAEKKVMAKAQKVAKKVITVAKQEGTLVDIDDQETQLKLRLYTMRELSKKLGKQSPPLEWKAPSLEDLEPFSVAKKQLDNFDQSVTILNSSIRNLVKILGMVQKVEENDILANINQNIVKVL